MSRSIRQGCPFAIYLYLFVDKALSNYLRTQQPQIRGFALLIATDEDHIGQGFANGTLLMVLDYTIVLDVTHRTLDCYCLASGARIN